MKARAGRRVTVIAFLVSVVVHLGLGTAGMYLFPSRRVLFQGSVSTPGEARLISVGLLTESPPAAPDKSTSTSGEPGVVYPEEKAELSLAEKPLEDREAAKPAPVAAEGDGGGDPVSSGKEYDRYLSRLREKIVAAAFYPRAARSRGWHGEVRLGFSVDPYGRLDQVELIESSRHSVFNRTAVSILEKASPFPAPVPELAGKSIALTVEFRGEP